LYKWYILGLVSAVIIEAILIAWLLFLRARRRPAEREKDRLAQLAEDERKKLDEVVSNVPGIVWETRIDPDTGVRKTTFISDYVENMLGYTPQEWLASPSGMGLTIMFEEDREWAKRESEAVIASGRERVYQHRWRTKDGRTMWAESYLSPMIDGGNKVIGLRGVTIDITERKKVDNALRESEARLLLAQQAANMGSFEWNIQTGETIWSPELEAMYGLTPGSFAGSQSAWESLIHPEDLENAVAAVHRAFETDAPVEGEWRVTWPDGSVHWLLGRFQVFKDSAGKPLRLSGINIDITDRKHSEAALVKSHEQLTIAHEEVKRLKNQLEEENIYLKEEIKLEQNFEQIVGESEALKSVLFKIQQVAPTDATVLITGETGTGKELVARAIHSGGSRADRPLVKVNCAALSSSLIESELFGHEKGAFTGAVSRKIGRFELANGGTIFLDEIGELPLASQVKLLRIIQEGEFERLGSSKMIKVDVRIIAATNRNLEVEVEKGSFREDLWYRLNVFPVTVPPLRHRPEDIPLLVEYFVRRFSKKIGKPITSVAPGTLKKLRNHSWPGNIRELANVLERAAITSPGSVLYVAEDFDMTPLDNSTTSPRTLEEVERDHIVSVLDETNWRIEGSEGAARVLGINPSTLRTRMMKLRIHRPGQSQSKSGTKAAG
ncbi:MAG TPA: sigma 54-interacting transcriptional regulator, partial [Pyrinomonadaceae bacterium]|nr:sigma 54-interacting transcriptional regulator [Pyrinomonadaceae bacterium]